MYERKVVYSDTTTPLDMSHSSPYGREEVYMDYGRRYETKTRCAFCMQKQSIDNNVCEFCGAPLP